MPMSMYQQAEQYLLGLIQLNRELPRRIPRVICLW
jgi:hypothetical protein